MVPSPTGALVPGPVNGTCGHRYQDGSGRVSDAQCECGTFAIGICKRCDRPVCGYHSTIESGVRLCAPCRSIVADERKAAWKQSRDARIAELQAIEHPVEQLIATMGAFVRLGHTGGYDGDPYERTITWGTDWGAINQVIPGTFDEKCEALEANVRIACKDADIAQWLANVAFERGLPTTEIRHSRQVYESKGLLGRRTVVRRVDEPPTAGWEFGDATVEVDGSFKGRFTAISLVRISRQLDYPESPLLIETY